MNVSIIYFSQTGNTRKVAEAMAAALREAGHTVSAIPLPSSPTAGYTTGLHGAVPTVCCGCAIAGYVIWVK